MCQLWFYSKTACFIIIKRIKRNIQLKITDFAWVQVSHLNSADVKQSHAGWDTKPRCSQTITSYCTLSDVSHYIGISENPISILPNSCTATHALKARSSAGPVAPCKSKSWRHSFVSSLRPAGQNEFITCFNKGVRTINLISFQYHSDSHQDPVSGQTCNPLDPWQCFPAFCFWRILRYWGLLSFNNLGSGFYCKCRSTCFPLFHDTWKI